jgi:hypothetical protein
VRLVTLPVCPGWGHDTPIRRERAVLPVVNVAWKALVFPAMDYRKPVSVFAPEWY